MKRRGHVVGVGLSYSEGVDQYETDDFKTAKDLHTAVLEFMKIFPEFAKNQFFVAGTIAQLWQNPSHSLSHYLTLYHTISLFITLSHSLSHYLTLYHSLLHFITLYYTFCAGESYAGIYVPMLVNEIVIKQRGQDDALHPSRCTIVYVFLCLR